MEKEDVTKKDRFISEIKEKYSNLLAENEDNAKYRKSFLEESLALKEELAATKDDNAKTKELLKEEEKNNKKLQDYINSLMKEK